MEDDELVTVATFNTIARAEAARERLQADGIRAMILDHESAPSSSLSAMDLAATLGGVKLLVKAADEDRAVDTLDRLARQPTAAIAAAAPTSAPASDAATAEENAETGEPGEAANDSADAAESPEQPVSVQTTDREVLAERTLRAQIFSFIIWPLQFVTLIFLIQVATSKERLSEKPRKAFATAVTLHVVLWLIFFMAWLIWSR